MIRLTPLRETASFQEAIKEDRTDMLLRLLQTKFAMSSEVKGAIVFDLVQLDMDMLETLFEHILQIESLEQLERWIADHQPTHA